jgi:hypothetical protein
MKYIQFMTAKQILVATLISFSLTLFPQLATAIDTVDSDPKNLSEPLFTFALYNGKAHKWVGELWPGQNITTNGTKGFGLVDNLSASTNPNATLAMVKFNCRNTFGAYALPLNGTEIPQFGTFSDAQWHEFNEKNLDKKICGAPGDTISNGVSTIRLNANKEYYVIYRSNTPSNWYLMATVLASE